MYKPDWWFWVFILSEYFDSRVTDCFTSLENNMLLASIITMANISRQHLISCRYSINETSMLLPPRLLNTQMQSKRRYYRLHFKTNLMMLVLTYEHLQLLYTQQHYWSTDFRLVRYTPDARNKMPGAGVTTPGFIKVSGPHLTPGIVRDWRRQHYYWLTGQDRLMPLYFILFDAKFR